MKLDEKILEANDVANIHIEKWVPQHDLLSKRAIEFSILYEN